MDGIVIREATTADMHELLRLEQGVIDAERVFDITLKRDATTYYNLTDMITAAHIHLLVAEIDQQIIGSGYARIDKAKDFLQHTHHAYLGFMFVDPAYRGKGVNAMIMDALKSWVRSQGLHELRLEVYTANIPAIRAYEKVGFEKLLVEMRMSLDDSPASVTDK